MWLSLVDALFFFPLSIPLPAMSDESNTDDLMYLAEHLSKSRVRIEALEAELEQLRAEPQSVESNEEKYQDQIHGLKADNTALRQQIAALSETVKAKQANIVSSALDGARALNAVLQEAGHTLVDDNGAHLWQKLKASEARVKESRDIATKAIREKIEAEKTTDTTRMERCAVEKRAVDLQATSDKLREAEIAGTQTISELRSKYEAVKAKKNSQRGTLNDLRSENEVLRRDAAARVIKIEELQEVVDKLKEDAEQILAANEAYRKYMFALPGVKVTRLHYHALEPVGSRHSNLLVLLAQIPAAKKVIAMNDSRSYLLAFGPTHQFNQTTNQWSKGSDLAAFDGWTREVFVDRGDFIVYLGSYKCHNLRKLCPGGLPRLNEISEQELHDAALGVPWPQQHAHLLRARFPNGKILVEATGLQFMGFNQRLYDTLKVKFASSVRKRKAEDEREKEGTLKLRKVNPSQGSK
ncbi:hypothetical protein FB45DRAFT_1122665 [Roridomyces roridus]|uniref:Uncharacterized protein n=1 Tax=Roridomyces roridus TaxID=1738132 RepID=A0AAD7B543_9AGAR|nr:hypothetical protein FB45DRAFT_1122665 [Roridomyces roridus]